MAKNISLFPTISDDILGKTRYQPSEYEFYYEKDDELISLKNGENDTSNIITLNDDKSAWNPNEYGFMLKKNLSFETYKAFFGSEGVACSDAVLGVALMWKSRDSRRRGTLHICDLKKDGAPIKEKLTFKIKKGRLRGEVEFSIVFYIKKAGKPTNIEMHLANEVGFILGETDNVKIRLDGSASMFPIYHEKAPNQSLWRIKCDWEDPSEDAFSDCIKVYFNTAHKNYKYLDPNKKTYNEQLLIEVMASALTIVVAKVKEDSSNLLSNELENAFSNGSVLQAIQYFIKTLEWDISEPDKLSRSIREYFERSLR